PAEHGSHPMGAPRSRRDASRRDDRGPVLRGRSESDRVGHETIEATVRDPLLAPNVRELVLPPSELRVRGRLTRGAVCDRSGGEGEPPPGRDATGPVLSGGQLPPRVISDREESAGLAHDLCG